MEKEAEVYKGFLDSNEAVIADPFLLYSGNIESFSINESETTSTVNISVVSHWADFDKRMVEKQTTLHNKDSLVQM